MKSEEFLKENQSIGDDAHHMHKSHQHHMLREECYHSAANAIELHKLIGQLPDGHELDAWAAEKISLANDYLKTVREWLEYDVMGMPQNEAMMSGGLEAFSMESAERQYAELLGESESSEVWDNPPRTDPSATVEDFFRKVVRLGPGKGRDLLYFAAEEGDEPPHIVKAARRLYKQIARKAGLSPEINDVDNNEIFDLMYSWVESKYGKQGVVETTSAGSFATAPAVGGGTLFGGSYQNPDNPFKQKKKSAKKESVIKR